MAVNKNNYFSFFLIIIISLLGFSCSVNKLNIEGFNTKIAREVDDGNYLLRNDGTKIYGTKIEWKPGLLADGNIYMDGEKYKINDIIGYKYYGFIYGRIEEEYFEKLVNGKLNVYLKKVSVKGRVVETYGSMPAKGTYIRSDYYVQKGSTGEVVRLLNHKEIANLVQDCPLAYEMINKSDSKINKAIKKQKYYLSKVFEIYNNDCKPVN